MDPPLVDRTAAPAVGRWIGRSRAGAGSRLRCRAVANTSALPDAVFHVDGDIATPTELARGPWSPHAQHGGAPAALLAGLLEGFDPGPATFPARFTVELMRPVPLAPLRLAATTIRPGKKVQLVQGSLFADDVEVVRATLLRLRERPVEFPTQVRAHPDRPMARPRPAGHLSRWLDDGHRVLAGGRDQPGPRGVDGTGARGTVATAGGADRGGGGAVPVAAGGGGRRLRQRRGRRVRPERYSCINPDLTITLHRLPVGAWVGLDSVTYPEPTGFGVAESVLHDERGRIGRAVQTVLIDEL